MDTIKEMWLSLIMIALLCVIVCGCGLQGARMALNRAETEIDHANAVQLSEQGRYHLNAAKNLLEAARREYEEADFYQTETFARQALEQAELARAISDRTFQRSSP